MGSKSSNKKWKAAKGRSAGSHGIGMGNQRGMKARQYRHTGHVINSRGQTSGSFSAVPLGLLAGGTLALARIFGALSPVAVLQTLMLVAFLAVLVTVARTQSGNTLAPTTQ